MSYRVLTRCEIGEIGSIGCGMKRTFQPGGAVRK